MKIIDISLIVVSLISTGLSLSIIRGTNNNQNKIFSLFILSVGLWSFGIFYFISALSLSRALIYANTNYIIAAMIPLFFLHFSLLFPSEQKINKLSIISYYLPSIILVIGLIIEPHLILKDVYFSENSLVLAHVNPLGYWIYTLYFIVYVVLAYKNLFISFFSSKDNIAKVQLKLIFIGTIIPYTLAMFFDLILPPFNYSYVWIGPLLGLIVVLVLVYTIYKYHLLNVKIITAQFFTICLWIFILIRILVAKTDQEIIINLILFILSIIFGLLLTKSVFKEINQRKKIETLALDLTLLNSTLSEKVAEQTREVKKAYELEKKARRDLEKLNDTKDQFIMITQHNLRTPVTSIRWELESMLSGNYGSVSPEIEKALRNTDTSVNHLMGIVDDFLNITTLKVGSQILQISSANLKPLLEDVLHELRIDIENLHLSIEYPNDMQSWPMLKIDSNKMREVLLIVVENAVRYNIDHGKIIIKNQIENNIFKMTIENTGIGIVSEDKKSLFDRLFFRSKRAQSAHPTGMGIGLSVSKAVLRAHNGDINIHSDGENMGAVVTMSLPIV